MGKNEENIFLKDVFFDEMVVHDENIVFLKTFVVVHVENIVFVETSVVVHVENIVFLILVWWSMSKILLFLPKQ